MFKKNILILFCLCTIPVFCLADEFKAAMEAYEQGDYQTAYQTLSRLSENDNAEAQYNLAFMYYGGDGLQQDDSKAAYWFERAAMSGHAAAQDILAYMYLNGRGRETNPIQAYAWYQLAADNGIFLAKTISDKLILKMSPDDRARAKSLYKQYSDKYKK